MNKMIRPTLTPEEKKRLRSKRIAVKALENYTINEIAGLLAAPVERAREIFFQMMPANRQASFHTNALSIGMKGSDAYRFATMANAAMPFQETGILRTVRAMQEQMDKTMRPFQSMHSGLFAAIDEMQRSRKAMTVTGLNSILTEITQQAFLEGSASKVFASSILMSETYNKLKIGDLAKNVVLGGLASNPDWVKTIAQAQGIGLQIKNSLGNFEWTGIGSRLKISEAALAVTQKQYASFSADYAGILKSLNKIPELIEPYPVLAKLPTVEFYTHTNALEVISGDQTDSSSTEIFLTDLSAETSISIESYLPAVDGGMPKMWQGAIEALYSNNPDRVRHFNVSVRELFTHLLQQLASDEAVKTWSAEPTYYHEGRPTRKARFLYICREISGGAYGKFLARDITSMLELIDLFQGGTHKIESDFTEIQLKALTLRVESALRFILEIEFNANRG